MANPTTGGVLELGSEPLASQSDVFDQPKLPRSLVRIPKAQKELLDKPESWAESARRRSGPNIPANVLAGLRQFYGQQIKEARREHSPSNEQSSNSTQNDQVTKSHEAQRTELSDEEESNEGTPIDWSPSPPRQSGQPSSPEQVSSPAQPSSPKQLLSPEQAFASQVSLRSPLRPTQAASNVQKRPIFHDFPSSAPEAEMEIEMMDPSAFPKELPSVNRTATLPAVNKTKNLIMPTPPSAQVQVPSTFQPDSSVPRPQSKKKSRQRPMRALDDVPKVQPESYKPVTTTRMLAPSKPVPHKSWLPDSSTDSSSSIITCTNTGDRNQCSMKPNANGAALKSPLKGTARVLCPPIQRSPVAETARGVNIGAQSSPENPSQESGSSSQQLRHSSPEVRRQPPPQESANTYEVEPRKAESFPAPANRGFHRRLSNYFREPTRDEGNVSNNTDHVDIDNVDMTNERQTNSNANQPTPKSPFIDYSTAYPNYHGNLEEFTTACVYIHEILEPKCGLASFLYDDFIREWWAGYVPHLGKSDKPITAIRWYMKEVEDVQFTAKVVTKHNIKETLSCYPAEVEMARKAMRLPRPQNTPQTVPGPAVPNPPRCSVERSEPAKLLEKPIPVKFGSPRLPPPPRRQDGGNSTASARVEVEPLALENALRMRSMSETFFRKRPADGDVSGHASKKVSHGSSEANSETDKSVSSRSMAQESANPGVQSTGSVALPKSQGINKFKRRCEKFYGKRKRDEIISSSALVQGTPTSGQKG